MYLQKYHFDITFDVRDYEYVYSALMRNNKFSNVSDIL